MKTRSLLFASIGLTLAVFVESAHAQPAPTTASCPTGQAVKTVNFSGRTVVCMPVVGSTAALEARVAALETALATANTKIACMSKIGDDVIFEGCNIHVRSGGGGTEADVNGLGNLIVGYNEESGGNTKTGSHNIVVGAYHTYKSNSGIVGGQGNSVTERWATVIGGSGNVASGIGATVTGGNFGTASGYHDSVTGGYQNTASGGFATVSGGEHNTASGETASVGGGLNRSATGRNNWAAGSLFQEF